MSSYLAAVEDRRVRYSRMRTGLEEIVQICQDPTTGKRHRFMNTIELADKIEKIALEALS